MNRLEDMRSNVDSLDAAKELLAKIAQHAARIKVQQAKCDLQITSAKAKVAERIVDDFTAINALERLLNLYIIQHPQNFQKPRKIVTEFGSFGIETETEVIIEDEEKLVEELMNRGYEDCLKVVRSPLKSDIRKRLKAGENIPFCRLKSGDVAKYKVSETFIKSEVEKVLHD